MPRLNLRTAHEMFVQSHVPKWNRCEACDLARGRKKVVFSRGTIPCDILFIGEAPGESEDVLGLPFVGPAGKLQDYIIERALPRHITYCLTNLVCCIPRDEGKKASEPPAEAIAACSDRLAEFIGIAAPKVVVAVGKVALEALTANRTGYGLRQVLIFGTLHPAYIIRTNVAQQGLLIQKTIIKLGEVVEALGLGFAERLAAADGQTYKEDDIPY